MNSIGKDKLKILIYGMVLFYCVFQMGFYATQVGGFPDESAHMSHVSYLYKHGGLVPELEDITRIVNKGDYYLSISDTDYTAHPPLYYKLMSFLGEIKYKGNKVYLNILKFRFINIFFTGLGIIAMFYIGLLLELSVFETLFYALACVSVPMLTFVGAGVNNDNLSYLSFSLVIIGLIFFERDNDRFKPYLFIGTGFMLAMLTKLTLGIVTSFTLIIYFIFYYWKKRDFKIIKNKYFIYTICFYLLPAIYYLYILYNYHTVQPTLKILAPEEFYNSVFYIKEADRVDLTFYQYLFHFWKNFLLTWTSVWSHIACIKKSVWEGISYLLLLFIPFLTLLNSIIKKVFKTEPGFNRGKNNDIFSHVFMTVFLAFIITMAIQFIKGYSGYLANGYLGGFQSRYYLYVLPALAVLNIKFMRKIKNRYYKNIIWTIYIALLFYQDFIYFLLNYEF